jgi:hypothetical protein
MDADMWIMLAAMGIALIAWIDEHYCWGYWRQRSSDT